MNAVQKHINSLLQVPVITALISFIIGTIFFGLFIAGNEEMLIYGFFYVVIAAIINFVILLLLIAVSFANKKYQTIILLRTSLMLVNIPVAVLYLYLIFNFKTNI